MPKSQSATNKQKHAKKKNTKIKEKTECEEKFMKFLFQYYTKIGFMLSSFRIRTATYVKKKRKTKINKITGKN